MGRTSGGTMVKIIPAVDLNKQAIKDAYTQAITDLQTIQAGENPTPAQIIWSIKKEAEILEKLLKFIKSQII